MAVTHRALDLITLVKQGNHLEHHVATQLKVFSRNVPDNKTNDVFHETEGKSRSAAKRLSLERRVSATKIKICRKYPGETLPLDRWVA
jgi:hypothetical protein